MNEDALANHWKDSDRREWPDDEHPAGQMYLHLSAIVGGFDLYLDPQGPPEPGSLTITSITSTGKC